MKKQNYYAAFFVIVLLATGCASPYMADRGHDAADIFTATVGVGSGAKGRVGPLHVGLFGSDDERGLRLGDFAGWDDEVESSDFDTFIFPPPLGFGTEVYTTPQSLARGKVLAADSVVPCFYVFEGLEEPEASFLEILTHYTQIEASAGLGGTLRLGFNPGELLDFIFGWTTLDIFRDDLQTRQPEEPLYAFPARLRPVSE
jgi:hypothetical protein